jgi:uncharacterized membrane protein (DUF106 family)
METRKIKFNLKEFSENYVYAHSSGDEEDIEELEKEFEGFYKRSSDTLKVNIKSFFNNSNFVKENKILLKFISKIL